VVKNMKKSILYFFIFFVFLYLLAYSDTGKDLIMAVARGRFELVKELVEKGVDVNKHYDSKGRTPIHWAVIRDNLKIAAFLISRGANVNARDKNMMAPIHYAAFPKDLDMVKLLVQEGADINALDKNGWSPLHYFAYYDFDLGVKYLLIQGAIQSMSSNKYMEISNKSTPLDVAIQKNNSNIIQALLNPDRYLRLSQKPYLSLSFKEDFGEDGVLTAPEKGFLLFNVENKGGVVARNVHLVIEKISNAEGLLIDETGAFDLYSGERVDINVGIEATREVKAGKAVLKVYARETNYFRTSDVITITIPVFPPQPPSFVVTAGWETNQKMILKAMEKCFLKFILKNTGKGKSENASLNVIPISGCEKINFLSISNITLLPGEIKNIELPIETQEELKDGFAEFFVILRDSVFNMAVTNRFKIETQHLFKPFFTVSLSFREKYQTFYVTNFISNDTITSNEKLPYVISIIKETNLEPEIVLFNKGEAVGKNISVQLNISEVSNASNSLHSFSFALPELLTNSVRIFTLPYFLTNYINNSNIVWHLSCVDEKRYSLYETNFQVFMGKP